MRLLHVTVSPEEKKHLQQALPFLLEEQLAEDIEDLHFATCPLDKTTFGVAVCRHSAMAAWEDLLADLPELPQWLPEPLLLPWQTGEWCLVMAADAVIVRSGECEGYTVEPELLPVLLTAAAEAAPPRALVVYGSDRERELALIPTALQDRVQWRQGNLCSALMLARDEHPLNLRQGPYAARLPLTRWWQQWRVAAMVLAVAFTLQLLATWADYRSLSNENLALRAALETSYRQAVPEGALVDAERQLRRQLDGLRGGGGGGGRSCRPVSAVGIAVVARRRHARSHGGAERRDRCSPGAGRYSGRRTAAGPRILGSGWTAQQPGGSGEPEYRSFRAARESTPAR